MSHLLNAGLSLYTLQKYPQKGLFIYLLYFYISEEAENERMHLLTALQLKQPSMLFKLSVIASQGEYV